MTWWAWMLVILAALIVGGFGLLWVFGAGAVAGAAAAGQQP